MVRAGVKQAASGMDIPKTMADARCETELALIVSIQKVLDRTGLKPSQVCCVTQMPAEGPVILAIVQSYSSKTPAGEEQYKY